MQGFYPSVQSAFTIRPHHGLTISFLQDTELPENGVRTISPPNSAGVICVRRRGGRLFAHADKCAHGRGALSGGDIEELGECEGGRRGADGAIRGGLCVRCPRHQGKFGGGLYFSVEDGSSYVKALTAHYTEEYRIDVFGTKVGRGNMPHAHTRTHA